MAKFVIEETMACWVTWRRVVEADTESEALDAFNDGEGESQGEPVLGDLLDGYDRGAEIVGVRSTALAVTAQSAEAPDYLKPLLD